MLLNELSIKAASYTKVTFRRIIFERLVCDLFYKQWEIFLILTMGST